MPTTTPTPTPTKPSGWLTPEQIVLLMANKRATKGGYAIKLNYLLNETDEPGVNANDLWPDLKDKSAASIRQSFINAAKKLKMEDKFMFVATPEGLMILVTARCELALHPDAATATTDTPTD